MGGERSIDRLSAKLLDALRAYWRIEKPRLWLFPGSTPAEPLATGSARTALRVDQALHAPQAAHGFRILLHLLENGLFPGEFALVGRRFGQLAAFMDGLNFGLNGRQSEILAGDDPWS